tara:strand:+ start:6427 stop:6960 length:534 start_codon:yes stop_codon:yes gene_type:complete
MISKTIGNSDAFFLDVKRKTDNRGIFCKVFQESLLQNIEFHTKEFYYSSSKSNVLRGFHLQINNSIHGKIVSCLAGKVLDVLIDLRSGEKFGCVYSTFLDSANNDTIFIPKGYGHAFLNLNNEDAFLGYLVDSEYSINDDTGILWSSVDFNWPIQNPIVSERDKLLVDLEKFKPLII